jgi:hypothetical protein
VTEQERDARIDVIRTRLAQMRDRLAGCDWCCGGGDEEWDALCAELERLGGRFPLKGTGD